jgi:hypothetical protein
MPGLFNGHGSSDSGEATAPPMPDPSDDIDYRYGEEFVAPGWVQRMYGPPPPTAHHAATAGMPEPAAVWVPEPATLPMPGGGPPTYIYYPQGNPAHPPMYQASPYEVHAYAGQGTLPLPPGAAVLRGRSPSTSTGLHHEPSDDSLPDYVVPPHPRPFEGSPTKSPFFAAGALASDDVEVGANRPGANDFSDATMPSRNIAMRERRKKQLRTCDKDSFGVPLPNTRRPFSLFASPFSIAEVCTGMGVYFASLQATVLLVFMLSVLCIYPLVDNVKSQRWADGYSLLTGVSRIGGELRTLSKHSIIYYVRC